ncbi:hypothetical protein P9112_002950 [Eukaryota sp. TZLM1-RC]
MYRFRRFIPPLVFILQSISLVLIVIAASITDTVSGTIGFISHLADSYGAYIIFVVFNSLAYFLILYIHLYVWRNVLNFWDGNNWEFTGKPGVLRSLWTFAELIIPILFYPFLPLLAIFDNEEYSTAHNIFVYLWGYPTFLQILITTWLLNKALVSRTRCSRVTNRISVLLKQFLILWLVFWALIYIIFSIAFNTQDDPDAGLRFGYIVASVGQWSVFLGIFAWHATFYYEISRIDDMRYNLLD